MLKKGKRKKKVTMFEILGVLQTNTDAFGHMY